MKANVLRSQLLAPFAVALLLTLGACSSDDNGGGTTGSGGTIAGKGGAGGAHAGGGATTDAAQGGAGGQSNLDANDDSSNGDASDDASADAGPPPPGVPVYISGYDSQTVGIYKFDATTAKLAAWTSVPAGMAPSYIAIAPSKKVLYVTDEIAKSTVTAFSIGADGALTALGAPGLTGGDGVAHIAITPDGKWLIAANYDSDSVTVVGLKDDGSVGAVSDTKTGCPSAHNVLIDKSGKFVLVACKSDPAMPDAMPPAAAKPMAKILQFSFAAGKLTPNAPAEVTFADPRHMTFDAEEKHVYVMTELMNLIYWFDYDAATGKLSKPQMVSALDAGGMPKAGGHIAFGGKFLYVSNRQDNSIGIFSIDGTGKPTAVGWQKTGADWVREFAFDPSGKYLLAANQKVGKVVIFAVDATTGKLTTMGAPVTVKEGQTAMITF